MRSSCSHLNMTLCLLLEALDQPMMISHWKVHDVCESSSVCIVSWTSPSAWVKGLTCESNVYERVMKTVYVFDDAANLVNSTQLSVKHSVRMCVSILRCLSFSLGMKRMMTPLMLGERWPSSHVPPRYTSDPIPMETLPTSLWRYIMSTATQEYRLYLEVAFRLSR